MRTTTILVLIGAVLGFAAAPEVTLPMVFIPNAGQTSSEILYMVQNPDLRAGFAADSAFFQIDGTQLRVRFAGANRNVTLEGAQALAGRANFLIGSDSREWKTNLPTYGKVLYRNLYPGIDATYGGAGRHVKSEFLVSPGADPSRIRMDYSDADEVRIAEDGTLIVKTAGVELREDPPVAYQTAPDGTQKTIAASYRLLARRIVGFDIGDYDPAQPLVIDPTITYSTYLGGSGMGAVTGLAIDNSGNLYVTGWTEALSFPIFGAFQAANRGGVDAFVVKINSAGSGMFYATYIGGSGDDRAAGIAVNAAGQAHVVGGTASANFPLAAPWRTSMAGGKEGFALKLTATGSGLVYSTFVGGANYDQATSVAVDFTDYAYIAGDTLSTDGMLMTPMQPANAGKMDGFVVKLSPLGVLQFGTFLGGANDEHVGGIAVDLSGNVVVAGGTDSPNFPVTASVQGTIGGGQDAFVTKIRTAPPAAILFSTFLGGSGGTAYAPEQANGIALDGLGNSYVTGTTSSPNFPVSNALQATFAGSRDAFLTKFSANGSARLYSTYLGSIGFDWAHAVAVDGSGNAYVAGYTSSVSFPTVGGLQANFAGLYDAFIVKVNPAGNGMRFATLWGGSGADQASAIAVDAWGSIYTGGQTSSMNFPTQNPLQTSNTGGNTGWVASFGEATTPPAQQPSADSANMVLGLNGATTITAVFSHPAGAAALTSVAVLLGNSTSLDFACHVVYDPAESVLRLSNDMASSGSMNVTPGAGSAQNNQCTLTGAGSGAVIAGNTLTLTLKLTLPPGFPSAGLNVIYIKAADAAMNTGWVQKGGMPKPAIDSVSPSSGSGAAQTFTFTFSDSQNALNVTGMGMLINTTSGFTNACYIVYDRLAGSIALLYDSALGSISKPLASTQVLQNTQCGVGVVTVNIVGQSITVTVAVTFRPVFNGPKNIYMFAAEVGQNTGWQQKGSFTVATGGAPIANGVSPSGGGGSNTLLSFTASDMAGASYISGMSILISSSLNTNNACYLNYDRAANVVSVAYDNSAAGSSPVGIGSGTVISNSQCTLRGAGSSVSVGATSVTLTLDLGFRPAFAGTKYIYLRAAEPGGVNSGWQQVGTWTIVASPPTLDAISPSAGSGFGGFFTVTVSDPSSAANISGISLLFTNSGPSNACWVYFDPVLNRIGLYTDNLSTLNTKPLGASSSLQNTRCAVGYSVKNISGKSVILTVYVLFKTPVFSGIKTISGQAHTAAISSGWVPKGSWSVP